MSVCLLIITLINDQLSHDNFHKKRARIYRVISQVKDRDGRLSTTATTTMPIAKIIENEYSGVEKTVTISKRLYGEGKTDDKLIPLRGLYADQSFFDVFGFSLTTGDKASALAEPFTIVLSEETALSLFNSNDVSGEVLEIGNLGLFTITGVVKNPPAKSHITFDVIASGSTMPILEKDNRLQRITDNWEDPYSSYVYILLEKDAHPDNFNTILSQIEERYLDKDAEVKIQFLLQSLSSITPGPLMNNKLTFTLPVEVIIFMGILAIIVMLSACFNYTNLSLSRALTRAKEVGIRKVTGATKWQVIKQFLFESILVSMLSMIIAILIFKFLLEAFNQMSIAQEISLNIREIYSTYFWFIIFGLIVGIIAGLSPALFLSSFKPIIVLKSAITGSGARASATHTGSIAGEDRVYEAAFKQSGIIRVGSFNQLFDVTKAFVHSPLPEGKRVAIINLAGSGCVTAVDACVINGLEIAELSQDTAAKIKTVYPD